jgi:quercetin dioxygenase-like cupin family protein
MEASMALEQSSAIGSSAPIPVDEARVGQVHPAAHDQARTPYQLGMPYGVVPDLVLPEVLAADERIWVPQSEAVSFRPLLFGVTHGYYVNVLRVRRSGVLSRHRHAGPVHAYVLRGRWSYLEHDWEAVEGGYAFEVPGEVHTLVVPDDVEEMMTLFHVSGALVYVDPYGTATGYEDVFTKLAMARRHYADVGLGADYADQFVR